MPRPGPRSWPRQRSRRRPLRAAGRRLCRRCSPDSTESQDARGRVRDSIGSQFSLSPRRVLGVALAIGHTHRVISLPIVAVVGRPNVGKSTLFNRIVGRRTAIVEDRARTTRDRIYGDADWNGRRFVIVDTGGLEIHPGDPIEEKVQEQARLAIGEADLILFIVDSITGLTPADLEAADLLRTDRKSVVVVANKSDNDKRELEAAEFFTLGWDETYPINT